MILVVLIIKFKLLDINHEFIRDNSCCNSCCNSCKFSCNAWIFLSANKRLVSSAYITNLDFKLECIKPLI